MREFSGLRPNTRSPRTRTAPASSLASYADTARTLNTVCLSVKYRVLGLTARLDLGTLVLFRLPNE